MHDIIGPISESADNIDYRRKGWEISDIGKNPISCIPNTRNKSLQFLYIFNNFFVYLLQI